MKKHRMPERKYLDMTFDKPTIRIGKKGTTDLLLKEIDKQLEKSGIVKVKVLKTAPKEEDTKEVAQKVAEETDSEIIHLRGHTFALYRAKKN